MQISDTDHTKNLQVKILWITYFISVHIILKGEILGEHMITCIAHKMLAVVFSVYPRVFFSPQMAKYLAKQNTVSFQILMGACKSNTIFM